jgi:uncharacterized protein (TIGR03067 family)
MMKREIGLAIVLGLLGAGGVRGADSAEEAKEKKAFEGTWNVTVAERDGRKESEEDTKNLKLIFSGDKITIKIQEEGQEAMYKLDPGKKPKAIDITPTAGPEKGKTFQGIYELEGDSLKLCWSEKKDARPTEFVTRPNSECFLLILNRAK